VLSRNMVELVADGKMNQTGTVHGVKVVQAVLGEHLPDTAEFVMPTTWYMLKKMAGVEDTDEISCLSICSCGLHVFDDDTVNVCPIPDCTRTRTKKLRQFVLVNCVICVIHVGCVIVLYFCLFFFARTELPADTSSRTTTRKAVLTPLP
jgi:hypothetical protein